MFSGRRSYLHLYFPLCVCGVFRFAPTLFARNPFRTLPQTGRPPPKRRRDFGRSTRSHERLSGVDPCRNERSRSFGGAVRCGTIGFPPPSIIAADPAII